MNRKLMLFVFDSVVPVRRKLRVSPSSVGSGMKFKSVFAAWLMRSVGIWLFGNGNPVCGSMIGTALDEKSPLRNAALGTVAY